MLVPWRVNQFVGTVPVLLYFSTTVNLDEKWLLLKSLNLILPETFLVFSR